MARVTVEDCLEYVDNRFSLVLKACKRARQLAITAADPAVPWENDKPTVVALREISDGYVDLADKEEQRVKAIREGKSLPQIEDSQDN